MFRASSVRRRRLTTFPVSKIAFARRLAEVFEISPGRLQDTL